MNITLKHPTATAITLVMSAFVCSADTMTLQPILQLLSDKVFPQYGYGTVSLIMSVSAVALFVISIATSVMTKADKKTLLITGCILFTAGGCAGALVTNLYFIIFTRVFEGLGAGLVMTVSLMLIPTFFTDQKKVDWLMGFNGIMTSVFSIAITLSSGFMALVNWKLPFVWYLAGLILLIMNIAFIPSTKMLNSGSDMVQKAARPSGKGMVHAIETCIYGVFTSLFFISISGIVSELGIGSSEMAGTVTTFNTIGSTIIGFAFAFIYGKLREFTPPLLYVLMIIGSSIVMAASGISMACVGAFIFGMGYNAYYSYFLARVSLISDKAHQDANMAVANGFYYLGQFLASFVLMGIAAVSGNSSTLFATKFMRIVLIILAVYFLVKAILSKTRNSGTSAGQEA